MVRAGQLIGHIRPIKADEAGQSGIEALPCSGIFQRRSQGGVQLKRGDVIARSGHGARKCLDVRAARLIHQWRIFGCDVEIIWLFK